MNRWKREQTRRREEFNEMVNRAHRDRHFRFAGRRRRRREKQKDAPWITFFHEDNHDWKNHDLYLMNSCRSRP